MSRERSDELKRHLPIAGFCVFCFVVCSCSKPKQDVPPELVQGFSNAVVTVMSSLGTNIIISDTFAAEEFLERLHADGRLPIDPKDEHANAGEVEIICDTVPVMSSNELIQIPYPAKRTFHISKVGEMSTNNYDIVKAAKDSAWEIQRAWETDSNGAVVKEWPVN